MLPHAWRNASHHFLSGYPDTVLSLDKAIFWYIISWLIWSTLVQASPTAGAARELMGALSSSVTEAHTTEGGCGCEDHHYLLDMVLAVLGAPQHRYTEYGETIRLEYRHMSDDSYKKLRVKVSMIAWYSLDVCGSLTDCGDIRITLLYLQ